MVAKATQRMQEAIFFSHSRQFITRRILNRLCEHNVFALKLAIIWTEQSGLGQSFAYIHRMCAYILLDFFYVCALK